MIVIANIVIGVLLQIASVSQGPSFPLGQVEKVIIQIKNCPRWADYDANDIKKKENQILKGLSQISENDLAVIREAVRRLMAEIDRDSSIDAQVFLLNRYLFQVPEISSIDDRLFGGWVGPKVQDGTIDRLWPFSYDNQHQLRLISSFQGYFGPQYDGLSEFDYFYRKFGLRKEKEE